MAEFIAEWPTARTFALADEPPVAPGERPIDWEWSSAREHNAPGSGRLTIDRESLPRTEAG